MNTKLPAVLIPKAPNSAISMERALKQIKRLLEQMNTEYFSAADFDEQQASIDDVDVMLSCIDRG